MSLTTQEVEIVGFDAYVPAVLQQGTFSSKEIYQQNRHRIYSLAFWMTDNELAAEELMVRTLSRALAEDANATPHDIDRALIAELRDCMPLGSLSLDCAACDRVLSVRRNILRVEFECAVVQLPSTEKLIFLLHDVERYDHARIAGLLAITEDESRRGVHQARLRLRELLAK